MPWWVLISRSCISQRQLELPHPKWASCGGAHCAVTTAGGHRAPVTGAGEATWQQTGVQRTAQALPSDGRGRAWSVAHELLPALLSRTKDQQRYGGSAHPILCLSLRQHINCIPPGAIPWIEPLTEPGELGLAQMSSHSSGVAAPHPAASSAGDAECDQIQLGSCKAQLQTAWEEIAFGFKKISFNLKRSCLLPSQARLCFMHRANLLLQYQNLNHCDPLSAPTCDLTSSTCRRIISSLLSFASSHKHEK